MRLLESSIAQTPKPPYYAVVFTSQRSAEDDDGYELMAVRMTELAAQQPGFLGVESVRDASGVGITVSYWRDLDSVRKWKNVAEHRLAQQQGRAKWYRNYQLRISRVEDDYGFDRERSSANPAVDA